MLTCPNCNVDSPRNDYQFCLNCGGDLETRTVVRNAARMEAKRVSPIILVSIAAGILGLVIGTAIVASNVSQTVKSSEAPKSKTYSDEYFSKVVTLTPRPVIAESPLPSESEHRIEVNEVPASHRRRNPAANAAANNIDDPALNAGGAVTAPPNLIAFCSDGSYAFEPRSWACADRGGAVKWYVSGIDDTKQPRAICNDGNLSYWRYDRWAACGTGGGVRYWYY